MNSRMLRGIGLLLALVGLVVLFLTPDLARTAGHNFIRSIGAVLLAVGLFRATQPEPK